MWNLFWKELDKQFVDIIGLQNFVEKCVANMVTKSSEQLSWTFMVKIRWKSGTKLAGKIRWKYWVDKLSGKSLQCSVYSTVYSKVVLPSLLREPWFSSVCWGSPCVTQFGEWIILPGSYFNSSLQRRWC